MKTITLINVRYNHAGVGNDTAPTSITVEYCVCDDADPEMRKGGSLSSSVAGTDTLDTIVANVLAEVNAAEGIS